MSSNLHNNHDNTNDDNEPDNARLRAQRTNRAVASRIGARLARPEAPSNHSLPHSNRSAVSSTPFGNVARFMKAQEDDCDMNKEDEEGWCGPFSIARRMIQNREAAKIELENRRRENEEKDGSGGYKHPLDAMVAEMEKEEVMNVNPSKRWKAAENRDAGKYNFYVKRRRRARDQEVLRVQPLFQICADFVVDNFEYLEGLGDVDTSIRKTLSEKLVERNKMNDQALKIIAEPGVEVLDIIDCANISEDEMIRALELLVPLGLKALLLNYSGRCFASRAIESIVKSYEKRPGDIFAISIGGGYNITDEDAGKLISTLSKSLTSIEFKACMQLGKSFSKSMAQNFASSTLTELALEDIPLTKGNLEIFSKSTCIKNLKNLRISRVDAIDDEIINDVLSQCGHCLEGLHLSHLDCISDSSLSAIRLCNSNNSLRSLHLCGINRLTSAGLETLFTQDLKDNPPPPMLRRLSLAENKAEAVTDVVIKLAAISSTLKFTGGLVYLNLNSAVRISDKSLEVLASTCARSIVELDLSFCHLIKDEGLGYLVSKVNDQFDTLHLWGCAQITEHFLDGHARSVANKTSRASLNIIGTWMKKAG